MQGGRGHVPGQISSAAETTASFSMGFIEQVEYTSRPPGLSSAIARNRILSWRLQVLVSTSQSKRGMEHSRMQTCSLSDVPVLPDSDILPERPITRAGHVGEDPIK